MFQDAIDGCRKLHIMFLWIDPLCIIHDSSDWMSEASQMEYVYRHSYLNIAASHATDGRGGLYVKRHSLLSRPCEVTVSWEGEEPRNYHCVSDWDAHFDIEPLISRGWVVQEKIVSPRICHFGSSQIIWECN